MYSLHYIFYLAMVFLTVYLILIQQGSGITSLYWSSGSSWVSTIHLCSPRMMNKRCQIRMTQLVPPSQAPTSCHLEYPVNLKLSPRQVLPLPLLPCRPAGDGALMLSGLSLPSRASRQGAPTRSQHLLATFFCSGKGPFLPFYCHLEPAWVGCC